MSKKEFEIVLRDGPFHGRVYTVNRDACPEYILLPMSIIKSISYCSMYEEDAPIRCRPPDVVKYRICWRLGVAYYWGEEL